jgi:tetratricopeptide (TPR) repeat protein
MMKPIVLSSRSRDWIFAFVLFAVVFAVYQPAWNGQPIWDDSAHITKPELRSIGGLARIWTQLGATQQYYPLVHSVFWMEYHIWGDSPFGYHLVNILLHILSALLLVRILRFLQVPGAWLAGAIFALHPVMVESVAWITELKNTLSGVLFLSTALAYLRFDRGRERKRYLIALSFFLLGLLSKSVIATLPASLLAVIWWKRGRIEWKRDVVPLMPFIMLGIASGLFTAWAERTLFEAKGGDFNFTIIERCLIAGRALWFYLSKLCWPFDLIFIYPRWNVSQAVWWQYLFPTAAAILIVTLWVVRKRWRAPLAVFMYFMATLFPALGFFNVYPFIFSFVADHFQYLAAIGPIVFAAGIMERLLGKLKKRSILKAAVTVIPLAALGVLSWKQSGMYSDAETLYRTTIRNNPACWMAHNNLGLLLENSGQTDEAMACYLKALEIKPDFAKAHCNLGDALAETGKTDEAIAHYTKALQINPNYAAAHINFGNTLLHTGKIDDALAHYQKAIEINPEDDLAHYNLGNILCRRGRPDEAIAHYRKALEINPDRAEGHYNLGEALAKTGRVDEAVSHYQKALQINPKLIKALNGLGKIMLESGKTDEAVSHYLKALEINPDDAESLYNLGNALFQTGRTDEAMTQYRKVLEISPNSSEAHNNLGFLLAKTGHTDEAIPHYLKALEIKPDNTNAIGNLSAAFVQKGQRSEAVRYLQKALTTANSQGDEALAQTISENLEMLTKAGKSAR